MPRYHVSRHDWSQFWLPVVGSNELRRLGTTASLTSRRRSRRRLAVLSARSRRQSHATSSVDRKDAATLPKHKSQNVDQPEVGTTEETKEMPRRRSGSGSMRGFRTIDREQPQLRISARPGRVEADRLEREAFHAEPWALEGQMRRVTHLKKSLACRVRAPERGRVLKTRSPRREGVVQDS